LQDPPKLTQFGFFGFKYAIWPPWLCINFDEKWAKAAFWAIFHNIIWSHWQSVTGDEKNCAMRNDAAALPPTPFLRNA
jgi:hypothetical protein